MGFRFKKSIKAGPFKATISKSGIGYSVGGKGFRVTKKAGGGVRKTASIPGTGISYVSDHGSSRKKQTKAPKGLSASESQYIQSRMSQLQECVNLTNTTTKPDVFFTRLHMSLDILLELRSYEKYGIFKHSTPSNDYDRIIDNLDATVNNFIDRALEANKQKIDSLKTESAKQNNRAKFASALMSAFNSANSFWSGSSSQTRFIPHYTGSLYTQNNYQRIQTIFNSYGGTLLCNKCGSQVLSNAMFCTACGSPVMQSVAPTPTPVQKEDQKPRKKQGSNAVAILLLIFCFPVGIYYMWAKTNWKVFVKLIICAAFVLTIIAIAFGQEPDNVENNPSLPPETSNIVASDTVQDPYAIVDAFIGAYNNCSDEPISEVSPMDIHGVDYKVEFRLNAFSEAVGKKGKTSSGTIEIVNYGSLRNDELRVYAFVDSFDAAIALYTSAANADGISIPDAEITRLYSQFDATGTATIGFSNTITGYIHTSHDNGSVIGYDLMLDSFDLAFME